MFTAEPEHNALTNFHDSQRRKLTVMRDRKGEGNVKSTQSTIEVRTKRLEMAYMSAVSAANDGIGATRAFDSRTKFVRPLKAEMVLGMVPLN